MRPYRCPQTLTLADDGGLNRSLGQVTLSIGSQTLEFGSGCDKSLEKASLPSDLQTVTSGKALTRA